MSKKIHSSDSTIIKLLQQRGLIKSEAVARLKQDVYRLHPEEVTKVKNYAEHFGIHAKEKLIDEILDLRREALIHRLSRESEGGKTVSKRRLTSVE
ncbi:hypothetical protein ABKZ05_001131 [Vibrio navarrensis]|uniref:Uncharacterized protein n=1 Tax=Vibrio navarrensis TaxID=29495 RepID=A0AAI9CRU1_9VIBR|nr:hypothetical protein [Vibrio navarrensis]EKA5636630.1 hypothetical protein [Vibrio navarrensis]ELN6932668.1 hypothetical protein [Vibrio navarrensis]